MNKHNSDIFAWMFAFVVGIALVIIVIVTNALTGESIDYLFTKWATIFIFTGVAYLVGKHVS